MGKLIWITRLELVVLIWRGLRVQYLKSHITTTQSMNINMTMNTIITIMTMNTNMGVYGIFQGSPERIWEPNEPRINKIVFIGKNLNGEELEKGFKDCLLKK